MWSRDNPSINEDHVRRGSLSLASRSRHSLEAKMCSKEVSQASLSPLWQSSSTARAEASTVIGIRFAVSLLSSPPTGPSSAAFPGTSLPHCREDSAIHLPTFLPPSLRKTAGKVSLGILIDRHRDHQNTIKLEPPPWWETVLLKLPLLPYGWGKIRNFGDSKRSSKAQRQHPAVIIIAPRTGLYVSHALRDPSESLEFSFSHSLPLSACRSSFHPPETDLRNG
jgi:hypothetical protein